MSPVFLTGLTLLASLSPLSTFASLWQTKEWRVDRLREHLRAEGMLRQLFGVSRPAILGILGILGLVGILPAWPLLTLLAFTALNALQMVLRRQPTPVWTTKALALVVTALLFTLFASLPISQRCQLSIVHCQLLPALPLLQPFFLFTSWLVWHPVDRFLKAKIMSRARRLRSGQALKDAIVIGITGSVGKTTTKELLAHILKDRSALVTPAYVNTEMGVSQWLIASLAPESRITNHESRILIIEMGAYKRGEIKLLCDIVKPTIGVLTFIGKQHIALFGSQEALQKTKAELFEALPEDGHAFLNADCELCTAIAHHARCHVTSVGTGGHADIEAHDIEETPTGIRFRVENTTYAVPLHGTHNVVNVLLSLAVARTLGMTDADIVERLKSYHPPSHTFAVREERDVTVLNDTHNSSPASFKAAIAWARTQPHGEKVLLASGIMELGAGRDAIHTDLGAVASSVFTRAIFLSKRAGAAFEKGFGKPVEIYSKKTRPMEGNALLCCIGRMSGETIERLLPDDPSPQHQSKARRGAQP